MIQYDHEHAGKLRITWEQFDTLCRALAAMVRSYDPQVIIGIAKGGLLPATILASRLQREFYPMRISRRHNERIIREKPELLMGPPPVLAGQRVLIVDDIAATGETLALATEACQAERPAQVRTACLCTHSFGGRPDYVALISDALVVFPWDRQALEQQPDLPETEPRAETLADDSKHP
jgi:hypothetical protein